MTTCLITSLALVLIVAVNNGSESRRLMNLLLRQERAANEEHHASRHPVLQMYLESVLKFLRVKASILEEASDLESLLVDNDIVRQITVGASRSLVESASFTKYGRWCRI
jgi:hypothetical protein